MCFKKWQPPHPEEKFNPKATEDNTFADDAIFRWYHDYNVPYRFREYWQLQVEIILVDSLVVLINGVPTEVPAGASDKVGGGRKIEVKPGWLNSGLISHEQAHNAYALLTLDQRAWFAQAYIEVKDTDQIKKLWKYNSYGTTNYIEAHAEIYRYLGQEMPEILKQFYPKLMEGEL